MLERYFLRKFYPTIDSEMKRRILRHKGFVSQAAIPIKRLAQRLSLFVFLALSISLIVIGKVDQELASSLRMSIVNGVVPVIEVVSHPVNAFHNAKHSVNNFFHTRQDNIILRQQVAKLQRENHHAAYIMAENARLKELLHFTSSQKASYVSARIIVETSGPYVRSATINAGLDQRIKKGQAIINETGFIGRVIEVGSKYSRILLITDINSRVPVISSKSRERAILVGNNSESLSALYLPDNSQLENGEVLLTSGDGKLLPAGLPVGVVSISKEDGMKIKPIVNWNRLEFVSAIDYK